MFLFLERNSINLNFFDILLKLLRRLSIHFVRYYIVLIGPCMKPERFHTSIREIKRGRAEVKINLKKFIEAVKQGHL